MGFLCSGQRHWHRAAILRTHLSDVPAAPHAQRLLRHRHWTGGLPKNRGTARGKDLGGITSRAGFDISVYDSASGEDGEMTSTPIEILLVEDNPGDVRLTLEAFKEGKVSNKFTVMNDGVEALAYLRREGRHAKAVQPELILLDLNLPKKDGREVLAEIKADERLMKIPVVIFTTSAA